LEARFIERGAFRVLGVQIRANPMQADYQDLWQNRYMPREAEIDALGTSEECYAVYFATDEEGIDDIMAAKIVPVEADVPEELVARDVPAAAYAVFDCQIKSIGPTWQTVMSTWLRTSGYQFDEGKCALEAYPPNDCEEHAEAPVEIWVPVRKGG